jgi:hypothetical protein
MEPVVRRVGRLMDHSIFAIELSMPLDTALHTSLRSLVVNHPERSGYQQKWALYREAAAQMISHLAHAERGCWDYFDDNSRALRDYDMWVKGMTTEEGARTEASGQPDPYRGAPRHMTLTMAFLIVRESPTDMAISRLCAISEVDLWRRDTFAHILSGMGVLNFASIKSDVIYVIPGDDAWGLTLDDLADTKFDYLRTIV